MEWIGLEWSELDKIEFDKTGLVWIETTTKAKELGWAGLNRSGLDRITLAKTGLD